MRTVEGDFDASGMVIGVVVASWNQTVTDRLLDGALEHLDSSGADEVIVLRVPGALEIPVGALALIERGCNAVVAIGTVIKGETDHYEIVVNEANSGVTAVATSTGVPIGNSILAVHDVADAIFRSGPDPSNKGAEAADAAVRTANALRQLAD